MIKKMLNTMRSLFFILCLVVAGISTAQDRVVIQAYSGSFVLKGKETKTKTLLVFSRLNAYIKTEDNNVYDFDITAYDRKGKEIFVFAERNNSKVIFIIGPEYIRMGVQSPGYDHLVITYDYEKSYNEFLLKVYDSELNKVLPKNKKSSKFPPLIGS